MRPLWPSLLSEGCLLAFLLSTRSLLSWLESSGCGSSLPLGWMIPHSFSSISVGFSRGCSYNIIIWRRSSHQLFIAAVTSPPQLPRRWLLHLLGLSFFSPLAELFGSASKRNSPASSFSPPRIAIVLSLSTAVSLTLLPYQFWTAWLLELNTANKLLSWTPYQLVAGNCNQANWICFFF